MIQDTFNVFQNPVDSMRVAAQDITSESVTHMLNWEESLQAVWNLVHLGYVALVCVTYYIVVTRVQAIKTNSKAKRNLLMLILTVAWGIINHFWLDTPFLKLLTTAMFINFCYENIFKWGFLALEKLGWTPLPEWHVEELRVEKQGDIDRAEQVKKE